MRTSIALAVVALAACGQEPLIVAYDVELAQISDCRQTGQSTQCTTDDELDDTVLRGRWYVEDRDGGKFLLTLEDGATLAGLSFPNDGTNFLVVEAADHPGAAVGCTGEGGTCFFARNGASGTDVSTGCARKDEHAIILHELEGVLRGEVVDAFSTDVACETASAAVAVVDVTGVLVDEPSLARERLAP
jgi:hypothetical protein